jgi:molybdopterin-guanine dinucleotide biosynthesis protein A
MSAFTAAIIAGGNSTRMGQDKAFIPLAGQPLIARVLASLALLAPAETILIANRREAFSTLQLPIYPDALPGNGSLGGIYTALHHSSHDLVLVVACDLPFLNADVLRHLLKQTESDEGFDAVVPRSGTRAHGLHAVYRRTCLEPMRVQLEAGKLGVAALLDRVHTCYVDDTEIAALDPQGLSFFNVNTPEDLAEAERIVAGR